ncbi:MAG TPA: hypothetical protein VFZ56_04335, partial [Gemmatimonadaceae bacterium]
MRALNTLLMAAVTGTVPAAVTAQTQGPPPGSEYLRVMQQMLAGPSPAEFLGSADDRFWFVAGPPDSAFITIVDPDAG